MTKAILWKLFIMSTYVAISIDLSLSKHISLWLVLVNAPANIFQWIFYSTIISRNFLFIQIIMKRPFSTWIFFHEYSQFAGHQGKREAIYLPMRTGTKCEKISCYMWNSASRWFTVKKAKIFWNYVKPFWIRAGVRKCRILTDVWK